MSYEVAYKHAKHVMKYPIEVGANHSWVCFDKLDANQKCILEIFRSNIKELSFEDLRGLLKRVDECYGYKAESRMESPEWYVYKTIIQRMEFIEPSRIPVIRSPNDFTVIDFVTVEEVLSSHK